MATRYWVGGTGNWNDTGHWSASSGGASGASVPGASDDVIFDGSSGGGTCTLTQNESCHDMTWTGSSTTIVTSANPNTLYCSGSLDLAGAGSGNKLTVYAVEFTSSSAGEVIDPSDAIGLTTFVTFNGTGGWLLADDLGGTIGTTNAGYPVRLTKGDLEIDSGVELFIESFYCDGDEVRSLTLNDAVFQIFRRGSGPTVTTPEVTFDGTNLTLDAGTSQINICKIDGAVGQHSTSCIFRPNGKTFYEVYMGARSSNLIVGVGVYTTLSIVPATLGGATPKLAVASITGNQTVSGTFTATGYSTTARMAVRPPTSNCNTYTISAGVVALTDCDFTGITAAGAASPFSGTRLGNGGGNTNITFSTVTRYWIGGTGNWNDTAHWSTSSGGGGGASIPLPHDNAIFDANSFSAAGQVVTYNHSCLSGFDFSAATNDPTLDINISGSVPELYGDVVLCLGMTLTGGDIDIKKRGDVNITTNGAIIDLVFDSIMCPSYTVNFLDDFATTEFGGFRVTGGILDPNDFDVTMGDFTLQGGTASMGAGAWVIYNTFYIRSGTFNKDTADLTFQMLPGGWFGQLWWDIDLELNDVLVQCTGDGDDEFEFFSNFPREFTFTANNFIIDPAGAPATVYFYAGQEIFTTYFETNGALNNLVTFLTEDTDLIGVETIEIVDAGVDYVVGDIIEILDNGDGGSGAQYEVTSIDGNGGVTGLSLYEGNVGGNYQLGLHDTEAYTFEFEPGTGSGLTVNITALQEFRVRLTAATSSFSYVDVRDNYALGGVPFDDSVGGVDSGNNINWFFGHGFVPQIMIF